MEGYEFVDPFGNNLVVRSKAQANSTGGSVNGTTVETKTETPATTPPTLETPTNTDPL
jgi:hypothetical protein